MCAIINFFLKNIASFSKQIVQGTQKKKNNNNNNNNNNNIEILAGKLILNYGSNSQLF